MDLESLAKNRAPHSVIYAHLVLTRPEMENFANVVLAATVRDSVYAPFPESTHHVLGPPSVRLVLSALVQGQTQEILWTLKTQVCAHRLLFLARLIFTLIWLN